jgi:hypothetical protein
MRIVIVDFWSSISFSLVTSHATVNFSAW